MGKEWPYEKYPKIWFFDPIVNFALLVIDWRIIEKIKEKTESIINTIPIGEILLVIWFPFNFQTPNVLASDSEFGQIVNQNDNKNAQTNKHHDTIKKIFKIKLKIVELKRAIFSP